MAQENGGQVRQLWHEQVPSTGRIPVSPSIHARRILLTATLLLLAVATCVGILTWLVGQPRTKFVSCWVTRFRDPTIPPKVAADHDREAILQGAYFARTEVASMPVRSRFLIQQQLDAVADKDGSSNIVLYVGTLATISDQGDVLLICSDYDPRRRASGLPLKTVLQSLAKTSARHKLLVLDIFWPVSRPGLPGQSAGVARVLEKQLASVPDANRLVLCSCSPGQVGLRSEVMGRTVFGYYFEQALRGAADGYNRDGSRNGCVSVREAAEMLRAKVDRWAIHNRSRRQTPRLLGHGDDFELTVYDVDYRQVAKAREVPKYPAWLLAGWKLRDCWEKDGTYRVAPRLFRQLEAHLLRTERQWRFGVNTSELKTTYQNTIADLRRNVDSARTRMAGPTPASLAAVDAAGHEIDPKASGAVAKVLAAMTALGPAAKPSDWQATLNKQLVGFDKQSKGVSDVDIALAVVDASTGGERLTIDRLQALAALLRHRQLSDQWIETRILDRLATKARNVPPQSWSVSQATRLLRIVRQNQQASCRYETMPWMTHALESMAQSSHDAEARFWARRYVPTGQVAAALAMAERRTATTLAQEAVFVTACRVYDQAMCGLPAYATYVNRYPAGATAWQPAIQATMDLGQLLAWQAGAETSTTDVSKQRIEAIQKVTADVQEAMRQALTPFSSASIQQLIRRCNGLDARPEVFTEIDAVLSAPLIMATDRASLWLARAGLAFRLQQQTVRQDQWEWNQGRRTATLTGYDVQAALRAEASRVAVRQRMSLDLLRLGGMDVDPQLASSGKENNGRSSLKQAAGIRRVWSVALWNKIHDDKDPARQARLSRIFPALMPMRLLDDASTNPTLRLITARQERLWSWLADRYRYETRDGADPEFHAKLAVRYAPYLRGRTSPSLQVGGPTRVEDVGRADAPTPCIIPWTSNRLSDKNASARIEILNPGAPWLIIDQEDQVDGDHRSSPLRLTIALSRHARFSSQPPLGFMVCWQLAGRTFHRAIDVPALADSCALEVLLSPNAKEPKPSISRIQLRPHVKPRQLYLYVRNHGPKARKLIVHLNAEGAGSAPLDIAPGQTIPVKLSPPSAVGKAGLGSAGAKGKTVELRGPLAVSVLDAMTRKELIRSLFPIEIIEPRQYLTVEKVRFTPANDSSSLSRNRLEIVLRQRGRMPGPPCSVRLDISAAQVPGLRAVGDGVLKGTLPPPDKTLTLFARDLRLTDGVSEQGRFSLTVDGIPRTLVFDTTFARGGDPTTPVEAIRPALQLSAPTTGRSGGKFVIRTRADYVPTDATLEVLLGRKLASGRFVADRRMELPDARNRHITFAAGGANGALQFAASVADWAIPLDTAGIVGDRIVKARLLASDQRLLAAAQQHVVLGNQPPEGLQFVHVPEKAGNQQPLKVTAQARDSVPGVTQVVFFLGKPANNAIPKGTVTVQATALDAQRLTWTTKLPLKKTLNGKTAISVQFTNAAGLSSFATTTVTLTSALVSGGTIRGTVVEGTIPQAGLEVLLKGKSGNQQKTTTAADGSFSFKNLKKGNYSVSASKPTSGRGGTATVQVNENATTQATIQLWL